MQRLTVHRPQHFATRAAALTLGLLFLGGQIASYVHLAITRHAQCAEHGELIEVAESTAPRAAEATRPMASIAASGSEHHHDHCTLAPQRRERMVHIQPLVVGVTAPAMSPSPALLSSQAVRSPSELVLLAPKTSPPA